MRICCRGVFSFPPDAISMVVAIAPWAVGVINQSREPGFTGPVFCPGIFGDINLINGMVPKKYAYDIFHGGPDVMSDKMLPTIKTLRKMMLDQGRGPFVLESVLLLDALYPVIQCIEKAQSFDPDRIVATINQMKAIDTLWGRGRWGGKEIFGVNHAILRPVTISRIVDGKVDQLDFIRK